MKYSRKQLKHSASDAIYVTRPRAGFVTLVYLLITFAIAFVFSSVTPNPLAPASVPLSNAVTSALDETIGSGDIDLADLPDLLMENMPSSVMQHSLIELFAEYNIDPLDEHAIAILTVSIMSAGILLSLLAWLIGLISNLLTTVIEYGYRAYTLSVFRHQKTSFGQLFCAFRRFGRIAGCWIMVGIFSFLWSLLPGVIGSVLLVIAVIFLAEIPAALIPTVLILSVAMTVAPIILVNRYALTPYAVLEHEELGVFGCIRRSRELMKGRCWNYFFLNLSFIGWHILIGLACMIILGLGILVSALLFGVSMVIGGIIALLITLLLVVIVPIPAILWLTGYQTTAQSGFYHFTVTGNLRPTAREQAAAPQSLPDQVSHAEQAPAKESSIEESPAEEPPAEEPPAEEPPAEEPPANPDL